MVTNVDKSTNTDTNNKTVTDIITVLDCSGSMMSMGDEPVQALNNFIEKQKETCPDDDATFSLYLFNDRIEHMYDNVPLKNVKPIKSIEPSGMTAEYDTIGKAIEDRSKIDTANRRTVLVIISDGCDNSSRNYTRRSINKKIEHLKQEDDWQVIFLGANLDVQKEGGSMGVNQECCVSFNQRKRGDFTNLVCKTSERISNYRHISAPLSRNAKVANINLNE